jgi:alkylation response protein AidB-like acyl-CoA dehydrogenase
MLRLDVIGSPAAFLSANLPDLPDAEELKQYELWWESEGRAISTATDRAGTPWLRMFNTAGQRVDEIMYAPDYWRMLKRGYREGVIWRSFRDQSILHSCAYLYLVSFYDPGLACPYTVSLSTAAPLSKYGDEAVKSRFLPHLLAQDETVWQGATWMTEIKGGSDLGAAVETVARPSGDHYLLTGDKYFASNVGAELAVVAARIEGAPPGVKGVSLFLLPRYRNDGRLNYFIRRIKDKIATRSVPTGEVELRDSEAYLLGPGLPGIYLILETLNISRVANSMGAVALAQRAIADAMGYAQSRVAFGKPVIEHPLLARQFQDRIASLGAAFALAWEAARLLNEVWQERAPYSDRYHLFRLVAHLAKYWTAEFAAQTAKWCMEVHGGIGILQEFGADRWLREALVLAIWEGTCHRQILDGLEVIERKHAHDLLFAHLAAKAPSADFTVIRVRIEQLLALPRDEREANAEPVFRDLAIFTGETLAGVRAGQSLTRASK